MRQLTRITRDPSVIGGKPCIRGMRVTVGTVVGLVAAGRTRDEILRVSLPRSRGHRRSPVLRRVAGAGSRSSPEPRRVMTFCRLDSPRMDATANGCYRSGPYALKPRR